MGPLPVNVIQPIGYDPGREGVWGFIGTKAEPRLIKGFEQQIFYVDNTNGYTDADGLDPNEPIDSLQDLIDRTSAYNAGTGTRQPILRSYDIVYITSTMTEDIVTADYTLMPSYVSIIGMGHGRYGPSWTGTDAATISLDLRCVGWRISNFRFYGKTTAASIELRHTDSGANDIAIRTVIDGCYFDGLTTGRYGIVSHGCYDVWVVNNTFSLFHNAVAGGGAGMIVTTTPLAIPYRNHVCYNKFYDNDNGCIWPSNGSFFYENMFQPTGYAYAMTQVLNTSIGGNPGDDNVVWGNTMPGDYSIAGGYNPGAADAWLGNWADDVAEAEVGDNGITIARPT